MIDADQFMPATRHALDVVLGPGWVAVSAERVVGDLIKEVERFKAEVKQLNGELEDANQRISNLVEGQGRGVYCREHGVPHDFPHMDRSSCPEILKAEVKRLSKVTDAILARVKHADECRDPSCKHDDDPPTYFEREVAKALLAPEPKAKEAEE